MNDSSLRIGVIVPTYNNGKTVGRILNQLSDDGFSVLAVNDGSRDDTAEVMAVWSRDDSLQRLVVTHHVNRGKAAALRTGFDRARELGWTHAITIDADGQLDPDDVPRVAALVHTHPNRIVCGVRDAEASEMLARSQTGRRWSNRLVRWNCGVRTADSQCGLRAYPLALLADVRVREGRYEYEAACLIRGGWIGIDCVDIDVACIYDVPEGRVSHFGPWRDTLRAARMHARLLFRSSLPWPIRRHPSLRPRDAIIDYGQVADVTPGTMFTRFLRWLDPRPAWRAVRHDPVGRRRFSAALALGVFIANLPAYGAQIALSLLGARIFRLPPVPVVTGAHLSTPPIGPLLVIAAIGVGGRLRNGTWPLLADFDPRTHGWIALFRDLIIEWIIGGVVIGAACAAIVFVVTTFVLSRLPQK